METQPKVQKISVTWRGKKFVVEMNLDATVKELGQELQQLTNIQEDTMRLIVPQISNKTSKLVSPFSAEHAFLSLRETSITEAGTIKMMGVSTNEVEEVLKNAKANLRIAGFEEEEKRSKQRISHGPPMSFKLPQGPYIFADFRTLEIPGVVLNPPPSEALKRMHMLAADPGIVAVMNKHRWHVGIMTEMAPVGYVGVSPKCILGFNKNHGEEISLRLRTDDLRGFRKYESIKKTLLHELAHMVYSEHDANFYSLDKQLNQEAASLDWTRSASHTLSGIRNSKSYEEDFVSQRNNFSQKLGGDRSDQLPSAHASSVAAAYHRMANVSGSNLGGSGVNEEPDPDDFSFNTSEEPEHVKAISKAVMDVEIPICAEKGPSAEPDPDDHLIDVLKHEHDPDNSLHGNGFYSNFSSGLTCGGTIIELKPHDFEGVETLHTGTSSERLAARNISEEPDPDDSETSLKKSDEPDSDDMEAENNNLNHGNSMTSDLGASLVANNVGHQVDENRVQEQPAHDEFHAEVNVLAEPDPDDAVVPPSELSKMQTDELDPDDEELQRIHDPVTVLCNRLQKALEMLRAEVSPLPIASVLQTLVKIIRNVIENPEETKYRKLRKTNPVIERNIVKYKAAMEILSLIGFNEDVIWDGLGKAESYLVLRRNDPGLLWLAKSSLESCITC